MRSPARVTLVILTAALAAGLACACNTPLELDRTVVLDASVTSPDGMREATGPMFVPHIDAGFDPFFGEWLPIPGATPTCDARYARSPENSLAPWTFVACLSNRCDRFVQDGSVWQGQAMALRALEPVVLVGGIPYVTTTRTWSNGAGPVAAMTVVNVLDGPPALAVGTWLQPVANCVAELVVGHRAAAVAVSPYDGNMSFGVIDLGGPYVSTEAPIFPSDFGLALNGPMALSGQGDLFLASAGSVAVPIWHSSTNAFSLPENFRSQVRVATENQALTVDAAGISVVHADGTYARLRTLAPGATVLAIAVDRSSNDRMTWVERGIKDSTLLWNALPAPSEAELYANAVARLTDCFGGAMVSNAGVVLTLASATTARLTNLSDGWSWEISAEPGDAFVRPLWVNSDRVWIAIARTHAAGTTPSIVGVVRYVRAVLGAPTVPPSL